MLCSVYWDFENCTIPKGMHGYEPVRAIKSYCLSLNLIVSNIYAIGNINRLSESTRLEMEQSGVILYHVTSNKPSAADITMLGELLKLVYFVKPPYSIILISGDRDFSKILSYLECFHYNVILIHSKKVSPILMNAVSKTKSWLELLGVVEVNPPVPEQDVSINFNQLDLSKEFQILARILKGRKSLLSSDLNPFYSEILNRIGISMKQFLSQAEKAKIVNIEVEKDGEITVRPWLEEPQKTITYEIEFKDDSSIKPGIENNNSESSESKLKTSSGEKKFHCHKRFSELVSFLSKISPVNVSKLANECREIHHRAGYSTMKRFLLDAQKTGVIEIANETDKGWNVEIMLKNHVK